MTLINPVSKALSEKVSEAVAEVCPANNATCKDDTTHHLGGIRRLMIETYDHWVYVTIEEVPRRD